jgi:hypothetical protein
MNLDLLLEVITMVHGLCSEVSSYSSGGKIACSYIT